MWVAARARCVVEILRRHPHLHGVLLEIRPVAARARAVLAAVAVDRWDVVAGDFSERVPDGADCHVMANVLHDWDDAPAIKILANCRRAMAAGAGC